MATELASLTESVELTAVDRESREPATTDAVPCCCTDAMETTAAGVETLGAVASGCVETLLLTAAVAGTPTDANEDVTGTTAAVLVPAVLTELAGGDTVMLGCACDPTTEDASCDKTAWLTDA